MNLVYFGIILEFGGGAALIISKKYNVEHVWVECKNQKTKVSYAQMQKTIHEYDEYKALKVNEFKFVEQYFVSSSGFVENALKLAKDKGVVCYVSVNDSFSEVSYWSD